MTIARSLAQTSSSAPSVIQTLPLHPSVLSFTSPPSAFSQSQPQRAYSFSHVPEGPGWTSFFPSSDFDDSQSILSQPSPPTSNQYSPVPSASASLPTSRRTYSSGSEHYHFAPTMGSPSEIPHVPLPPNPPMYYQHPPPLPDYAPYAPSKLPGPEHFEEVETFQGWGTA